MKFHKYHGLGNDYLVIDPRECSARLDANTVIKICHRSFGVGADGILFGPHFVDDCFSVTIFNPDGSEAEKSGNGLRIFSRYLWDLGLVKDAPFVVRTAGGDVVSQILDSGRQVRVEMGPVSFDAADIPVRGESGEVINRRMEIGGRPYRYCAATVGNPHCVVIGEKISPELAKKAGPLIETDKRFPNRTNVQFMEIIDSANIRIEIWERGAGYTLASGSSSTAAAAVALRLQECGERITVHMPGGSLFLEFAEGFRATMTGPVVAICDGTIRGELLQ